MWNAPAFRGMLPRSTSEYLQAQRVHPDTAQFLQNSQPSVVFNHYHSTEPGRFEDGGPLMEFVNSGGQATSICACGTLKPQQDLTSCILVGSKSGMVSSLSVTVPQRTTAQVEDITVRKLISIWQNEVAISCVLFQQPPWIVHILS